MQLHQGHNLDFLDSGKESKIIKQFKREMYEHQQISRLNVHHQCEKLKSVRRIAVSVSVSKWPVVVRAVPLDVNSTDTLAKLSSPGPVLFLAVRATVGVAPPRGLQQGVVRQRHRLVKQGVQSFLIDASFRKLHLR